MRKVPRSLLVVVALGVIAVALRLTVFKPEILRVEVARVDRGPVEETVTNTRAGTIQSRRRASLSTEVGGRVEKLPVRKGDRVRVGEVLLEAHDNLNIDNMEGIAAHRSASGETILTLISDDNFSALQRTLLMQFALPDGKPVLAEPGAR